MSDPVLEQRPGGKDGVCFTSGPKGAAFGAGVIHAWLASDRQPPVAVAGISTGALSGAALQRCYRDLERATETTAEVKRWEWFRQYLNAVTNDPLSFLWRAIPDPVDFFADKPPVRDLSTARLPEHLKAEEPESRRHFHLLTKLGVWVGGLPVRVRTVARIAVYYVRWKEGYGLKWKEGCALRLISGGLFLSNSLRAAAGVWWHVAWSPKFFSERGFGRGFKFRPLFGWRLWLTSYLPAVLVLLLLLIASLRCWPSRLIEKWILLGALLVPLSAAAMLITRLIRDWRDGGKLRWFLPKYLFAQLGMSQGLLCQFELKRQICNLFGEGTITPELSGTEKKIHLLVVCAALQQADQVWPCAKVGYVEALSAALAIPGLFPPICIDRKRIENYRRNESPLLVDGVVVRNNPIPAFFKWCRCHPQIAAVIEQGSLHVVYNVPTEPEGSVDEAPGRELIDIVESALTSIELEKRRDTRQEVRQTNFVSRLEEIRRRVPGAGPGTFKIEADEIAPTKDISFHNEWEPTREESLQVAAQGCRAAMETLYRKDLKQYGTARCSQLIRTIAPRRLPSLGPEHSGLPEICAKCTGMLTYRPEPPEGAPPRGVIQSYGEPGVGYGVPLHKKFSHLNGDRPRIVFLGSGGVFRGAFHIGVIAAMQATRLFPDLVLGASVGALMGGALASISVAPPNYEIGILETLTETFLCVDGKVALTRTLKNAAKQIGVRARDIAISPAELRRMVRRGSRSDPGYAATGAPPALIDALSRLFMIPHRRTAEIASDFIAGHFTGATDAFLTQLRHETLTSFDIQRALMGVSLLEHVARELLGENVPGVRFSEVQPYHYPCCTPDGAISKPKVSFFATTAFLNAKVALLLGRDFLTENPSWEFIFAALSSSAFPAVFSPRSEAEVVPGRGRTDRLFADGGMFDNLPFFPALEILGAVQTSGRSKEPTELLRRLNCRVEHRDLLIAAGLNAAPQDASDYDTVFKIRDRAKSLSVNSKVATFVQNSEQVQKALRDIAGKIFAGTTNPAHAGNLQLDEKDCQFLDRAVTARVINILPTDREHVNPTFAFCRATGLEQERVSRSIADGCFRSLIEFLCVYKKDATTRTAFDTSRVKDLRTDFDKKANAPECPYFKVGEMRVRCPFALANGRAARNIRDVCAEDERHREEIVRPSQSH